ncbi:MAG: ribose 5-phosphate isomerase B [Planctomycetota bacterium]|nr:ribose 5-phosphate isomerase B [Planctomycetota bacterium]
MRIAVAADHAAVDMKEEVVRYLKSQGHKVDDLGPFDTERVDYPDYAARACDLLVKDEVDRVVLICGSGIGMAMSANKIPGCRAAVIHDPWEGEMCRRHNNANVACFGSRSMGIEMVTSSLGAFLDSGFDGGRHTGRVAKMSKLDGSATPDLPGE